MEMKTLTVNGQTYTVADPDAAHIDDSSTAPDKTWSAQKLATAFENLGPSGVALDDTLTQSGKAADAKAVGDKLGDIETALDSIIEIQNDLIGGGTE